MGALLDIIKDLWAALKSKRAKNAAEEIPAIEKAAKDVQDDADLIIEELRKPPLR